MCRLFFSFFFLLFLCSCAGNKTQNYSLRSDQYWSEILNESEKKHESILGVLKKRNGRLYQQIVEDARDPLLKSLWGQSLNFDSGAKKQIINDEVLLDLLLSFNEEVHKKNKLIVPAGITHTYGYLFSDLVTPYGFKRKRWIMPTLNFAFGLKQNSLSPYTEEGGLLSNVTYFAGMLAFKNKEDKDRLKDIKNVSREVRNFNYFDLTLEHLEEELSDFSLRTTLLRLPKKDVQDENDYLLIYSIFDQSQKTERLITMFPINLTSYKKIVDPKAMGDMEPISIRYNAYLEGKMEGPLLGKRFLWGETR